LLVSKFRVLSSRKSKVDELEAKLKAARAAAASSRGEARVARDKVPETQKAKRMILTKSEHRKLMLALPRQGSCQPLPTSEVPVVTILITADAFAAIALDRHVLDWLKIRRS
jgi:hypothetical protein